MTTVGAVGAGSVAGCTDDGSESDGGDSDGPTVQASFFAFGDIASNVAGDTATADLLVPVGQHGHGWEPGPRVREDIHDADLLVHGMDGFQPWVDDVLGDLEADGSDVRTVDVSTGINLLEAGEGHDHEEEESHENDHEGDHGHEEEDHEHTGEEPHEDEDEDEHGTAMDPHFWMDPVRLQETVDNVRQGLVDVDSDGADDYAENAAQFRSRLDDLHEGIGSTVEDASNEVILVAGHNSFRYVADRYDIEVEALTNVSPDDRPTTRDIERAQAVIDEHDLQYICADPLEAQEAAEQLVAETDVEEVLPLTSIPGLTEEWAENDWGYVEVMENVNLPTLERALDV